MCLFCALADVVYDPDVTGSLVELLSQILSCQSAEAQPEILICSAVRNPETYRTFKQQLGKNTAFRRTCQNVCTFNHLQVLCLNSDVCYFAENAGLNHHVLTGGVSPVFPYNRLATVELMKLYR